MMKKTALLNKISGIGFLLAFTSHVHAQGLYGVSAGELDSDFSELPIKVTVGASTGYDSNRSLAEDNEEGSVYSQISIGAQYGAGNDSTGVNLGISYSGTYYWNQVDNLDDYYQNVRYSMGIQHSINDRITVSNSSYIAYEIEPDYKFGSINSRTDQYLYGYSQTAVHIALTERLSTGLGYTISGIKYDENAVSTTEDRLTHLFNTSLRYELTPMTTAVVDYRFQFTNYENRSETPKTHSLVGGLEYMVNENLSSSFRTGVSYYDNDLGNESWRPFFEGGLNYNLDEDTRVHMVTRLGFEENETSGYKSNYTWRTSLGVSHMLTSDASISGGVVYSHSEYTGRDGNADYELDLFSLSLGASYVMPYDVMLNIGYSFSYSDEVLGFGGYDRHRVDVGMSKTF